MSPTSSPIGAELASPGSRLDTLPPGLPEDYEIRTLGYGVARWCHEWLIQPNGPRAGKPFRLTLRQWRFLLWFYALDDEGHWLFNGAVRRLAKGSGKSPFAAVLALVEFLGPVRLDRFDDREAGGCRGRAMHMPLVQIAATAESQTANTMRMVRAFAPKRSRLVVEHDVDVGKTQFYKLPEGTLEVITSSSTAAEGGEASFIVADETEHWKPSNGGPELSSTLADNLAKSGSRMLSTCNAWVPGISSVAEDDWNAWVAQEEGKTQGETSILYDAVLAPPDTNLADPASLQASLEFVYDDCDWKRKDPEDPDSPIDVRPIMEQIWKLTTKPDVAKRKYLNWPTVAEDAWTTPADWALLAKRDRLVAPGEDIVLFFDGSKSQDATALVGCCMSDGHVFTVNVWEPSGDGDTVDAAAVDLEVDRTFELYTVRAFFADVREWESFTKVLWPERYAEQLEVMAVPGGRDPQAIAWDMRGHGAEFTRACELVETEINERAFTHDDDPVMSRHVANMRRRPNRYGVSVGKESPKSPLKIDAGVCVIGARMVRRIVLAAAPKKRRTGGVWL